MFRMLAMFATCCGLACVANAAFAQEVKLTVEVLAFEWIDAEDAPATDKAVLEYRDRAFLADVAKSKRQGFHESFSTVVQTEREFDMTKTQAPRTIRASGKIDKCTNGEYRVVDLKIATEEAYPDPSAPEEQPCTRRSLIDVSAEVSPGQEVIYDFGISKRTQKGVAGVQCTHMFRIIRVEEPCPINSEP